MYVLSLMVIAILELKKYSWTLLVYFSGTLVLGGSLQLGIKAKVIDFVEGPCGVGLHLW